MLLLCLYLYARHTFVDGRLVGSHSLVSRFRKGELLLRPPHTLWVCSRDLLVVLEVLMFYFLSRLCVLTLGSCQASLLTLTSTKRDHELHELSLARDCSSIPKNWAQLQLLHVQ